MKSEITTITNNSDLSLLAFVKEYLIPVMRYTADKKAYIFEQESKYYTGQDRDDFDQWARNRASLAVEKWDAAFQPEIPGMETVKSKKGASK